MRTLIRKSTAALFVTTLFVALPFVAACGDDDEENGPVEVDQPDSSDSPDGSDTPAPTETEPNPDDFGDDGIEEDDEPGTEAEPVDPGLIN